MIKLKADETQAFLRHRGFVQSTEDADRFVYRNSDVSIFVDWNGRLDQALCQPCSPDNYCIHICRGETAVITDERFDLTSEGLFDAIYTVQMLAQDS